MSGLQSCKACRLRYLRTFSRFQHLQSKQSSSLSPLDSPAATQSADNAQSGLQHDGQSDNSARSAQRTPIESVRKGRYSRLSNPLLELEEELDRREQEAERLREGQHHGVERPDNGGKSRMDLHVGSSASEDPNASGSQRKSLYPHAAHGTISRAQRDTANTPVPSSLTRFRGELQKMRTESSTIDGVTDPDLPSYSSKPAKVQLEEPEKNSKERDVISVLAKMSTTSAVKDRWAYFLRNLPSADCLALQKPSFADMPFIKRGVFSQLFRDVVKEWCEPGDQSARIFPKEACNEMLTRKLLRFGDLCPAIIELCISIQSRFLADGESSAASTLALQHFWWLFFQRSTIKIEDRPELLPKAEHPWPFLPADPVKSLETTRGTRDLSFAEALQVFVDGHYVKPDMVASAALASLTIFRYPLDSYQMNTWMRADPLVRTLSAAVTSTDVGSAVEHIVSKLRKKSIAEVSIERRIQDMREAALTHIVSVAKVELRKRPIMSFPRLPRQSVNSVVDESEVLKQLARAVEQVNVRSAAVLWERIQDATSFIPRSSDDKNQASVAITNQMSSNVYGQFIQAFMTLRSPEAATRIWNTMIERGVQPTVKTWTSTMAGCTALRDTASLEQIWHRMLQSGQVPDAHAWGTRIHGLISGRKINAGLQCLDEMGRLYRASLGKSGDPSSKKNKVSKSRVANPAVAAAPNADVVAAAMSALARIPGDPQWETMERVLKWASEYGIQPNTYIYNPLLRLAFDKDDDARIQHYLKVMEQQGIELDEASHTIFISNLFRMGDLGSMSPAELEKTVMNILQDLEGRIQLNAFHYTTLIDGLVRADNTKAVRVVIDFMTRKGLNVPASVLTILARYYFSRDPPDVAAAGALWTRACGPHFKKDIIFFDRMIEGFAKNGEVGQMMNVLRRMSKEGKRAGWQALVFVTEALLQVDDLRTIRDLVKDVKNGGGQIIWQIRPGIDAVVNERRFWELVSKVEAMEGID